METTKVDSVIPAAPEPADETTRTRHRGRTLAAALPVVRSQATVLFTCTGCAHYRGVCLEIGHLDILERRQRTLRACVLKHPPAPLGADPEAGGPEFTARGT